MISYNAIPYDLYVDDSQLYVSFAWGGLCCGTEWFSHVNEKTDSESR